MLEILQPLSFYGRDSDKLKEIVKYMLRKCDDRFYSCFPANITINKKVGDTYNYIQIPTSCMIYFIIPKFFKTGKITLDLADPITLLNYFYDEYKKRIQSEETSEEIPIKEKLYEPSSV